MRFRTTVRTLSAVAAALFFFASVTSAQRLQTLPVQSGPAASLESSDGAAESADVAADSVTLQDCRTCVEKRVDLAVLEMVLLNVGIATFNRYMRNEPFNAVSPETWSTNFREGFNWDDNTFSTNFFAHPFHGSTYFNSGRTNGLDFWESVPVAMTGSLIWEFLGEAHRPAFNDWMATTMGGVSLGEVLYRLSSMVLDNEATGSSRMWKEIGGAVLNPIRDFNRLMTGRVSAVGPNEFERDPGHVGLRLDFGARRLSEGSSLENGNTAAFFEFDFEYGDFVESDLRKPFQAFHLTAQINAQDKKALGWVAMNGNLYSSDLKNSPKTKHRFMVELNYTYIDNKAYQFGQQSVTVGFRSRWHLSDNWKLRGRLGADVIVLGAVNSEFVGVQDREYDFGPGLGLIVGASLVRKGFQVAEFGYEGLGIHTVSGADGNHIIQAGWLRVAWPVFKKWGVGADYFVFLRDSYFKSFPDVTQRNPQLRLFATWHPN